VEGDRKACRRAEARNFVPSADRRSASEDVSRMLQQWSRTAVARRGPVTGIPILAIDLPEDRW
jgi:hypothetical protein